MLAMTAMTATTARAVTNAVSKMMATSRLGVGRSRRCSRLLDNAFVSAIRTWAPPTQLQISPFSSFGIRGDNQICKPCTGLEQLQKWKQTNAFGSVAWYSSSRPTQLSQRQQRRQTSRDELVVSILGPPNAGKSTLFNRLQCKQRNKTYRLGSESSSKHLKKGKGRVGSNHRATGGALVSSIAGTTRDRRQMWGRIGGTTFSMMDTAGVDGDRIGLLFAGKKKQAKNPVELAMIQQTLEATKQCDIVFLMFDAKVGVTQDLEETARWLRKLPNRPEVAVLANKLEGDRWSYEGSPVLDHLDEALRLGFGEAVVISAEHGEGMADIAIILEQLMDKRRHEIDLAISKINESAEEDGYDSTNADEDEHVDEGEDDEMDKPLQLAILGRQNVGKSTLVNEILQKQRVITGDTPGLTRDAITIPWEWNGRPVQIVDTAGIRKMSHRFDDTIENMSVADALRAMKLADVGVLVLDAGELYLQRQELAIADAIIQEGRALVVAANKMDLLEMDGAEYTPEAFATAVQEQLEQRIPMLRQTPIVPMSCLTGENVKGLMPVVFRARDRWARKVSTGTLNGWLKEVLNGAPSPVVSGVTSKIKYIIQTKGRPPTFLLFCNVSELPETYLRYLTRNFQETFGMYGMQVRLVVKKSAENPFASRNAYGRLMNRKGSGVGGKKSRKQRTINLLKTTGTNKMQRRKKRRHRR